MRTLGLFLSLMMFFFQTFQVDNLQVNGVINGGLARYAQSGTTGGGVAKVYPSDISTDVCAAINSAGATLPSPGNGVIDGTALGPITYTCTNQITALNVAGAQVLLVLMEGTKLIMNVAFSGSLTNSPANCAIPIGGTVSGGGGIIFVGHNDLNGNILVGSAGRMWDLMCNGNFSGAQQSLRIDGVSLQGNSSATVMGSLLHLRGLFVGTRVSNSQTYLCYANCVEIDPGTSATLSSDLVLDGDNFVDGATSGTYPGCVFTVNAVNNSGQVSNVAVIGGAIQLNGPHNPLVCINGQGGTQTNGFTFLNVDHELAPATPSSYWTNVDPIQLTDTSNIFYSNLRIYGVINSTYQTHAMDISQTISGNSFGLNIQTMTVNSTIGFSCLINNTIDGTCETGYGNGQGVSMVPDYQFNGLIAPDFRMSSYIPSGSCFSGSQRTYSGGTTGGNNNLYICSQGTWVAVK